MEVEKVVISLASIIMLLVIAALPANSSGGIGIGVGDLNINGNRHSVDNYWGNRPKIPANIA